jgi:uncharacterized protein YbcV (DUF1398 family)
MFTIEQIKAIHAKVKSGADFPAYVQELKNTLGITHYDLFVKNGQGIYYGADNFKAESAPAYSDKTIADKGDAVKLKHIIKIHQQGQTDYPTFVNQAAEAGVEKWTTSMERMEVIYYDKAGNEMLVEPIPDNSNYAN